MRLAKTDRALSEWVSVRVSPSEKEQLESKAAYAEMTLSEWGRGRILDDWPTRRERRQLIFQAIDSEVIRLTLIAAQAGEDITSKESQERIERQARTSAESVLDRRLSLVQVSKGVA